ncbi:hypothetical protein BH11PSE2_BH11PSE2_19590 [soil metagenome]
MIIRSTFAKSALCAALAATTLTAFAPVAASAQSSASRPAPTVGPDGRAYDAQGGYYYDGCRRSQNNRSVGGGLAGAAAGAVIGGNVASRKTHDEGAILGGLLGAVVGSQIGKSTAACETEQRQYSYDSRYDQQGYAGPVSEAQPVYGPRDEDRYVRYGRYEGPDYDYDSTRDYRRDRDADDSCRMIESSVRMPDGRVQTRMVQACRDSRGQYQLVE